MRSSILGIYHPGGVFHPSAINIGQFGKLTDRTEGAPVPELKGQFDGFGWLTAGKLTDRTEGSPVPEPVEGALTKPHIYTVAYASGSERSVLFPWLFLLLPSVSLLLSFPCFSVLIRGKCFCLFFLPWLRFCYFCLLNMGLFRICRGF